MEKEKTEKMYKPVPDVEALRYKGTPDKPDIKIFVSHRIDQDSETIDNPLYIPVRCGAVYDKRENVTMLGDDVGNNISEKYPYYGIFSLVYFAWKNIKADYYGFCRDDSYMLLSSSNMFGDFEREQRLDYLAIKKYKLAETERLADAIYGNIAFMSHPIKIPKEGKAKSLKDFLECEWRNFEKSHLQATITEIERIKPEVAAYLQDYLNGDCYYFMPNFLLSRSLMEEFCDFVFPVLDRIFNKTDTSKYGKQKARTFEVVGNLLLVAFLRWKLSPKEVLEVGTLLFNDVKRHDFCDLYPAFCENNNTVVLSSSDTFSPYLGVCIKSIIVTSSSDQNYDIIVLERNISEKNKKRILSMLIGHDNIRIRFLNVYSRVEKLNFYLAGDRLSQETYYSLLTPFLLPHYDKAITMDCDMIVKCDIAELFKINLEGYAVAAVEDVIWQGILNNDTGEAFTYAKSLGLQHPYHVFNGGLIYVNFTLFRELFPISKIEYYINNFQLRTVDQDIFNCLCEGNVRYLDQAWNHMIAMPGGVQEILDCAPIKSVEEFEEARMHPKIIHYAGGRKPWYDPNVEFGDDFWSIARETPFYESLISDMFTNQLRVYDPIRPLPIRSQSRARDLADKLLPKGSHRRNFLKKIMPKGSPLWNFCKKIYRFFDKK